MAIFLSCQNEHAVRDVIADVFDRWVPVEGAELRHILDREISKQGLSEHKDRKISEICGLLLRAGRERVNPVSNIREYSIGV